MEMLPAHHFCRHWTSLCNPISKAMMFSRLEFWLPHHLPRGSSPIIGDGRALPHQLQPGSGESRSCGAHAKWSSSRTTSPTHFLYLLRTRCSTVPSARDFFAKLILPAKQYSRNEKNINLCGSAIWPIELLHVQYSQYGGFYHYPPTGNRMHTSISNICYFRHIPPYFRSYNTFK